MDVGNAMEATFNLAIRDVAEAKPGNDLMWMRLTSTPVMTLRGCGEGFVVCCGGGLPFFGLQGIPVVAFRRVAVEVYPVYVRSGMNWEKKVRLV